MSIYSPRHWQKQKEDDKPFKIVTVEYFEEHELDETKVTPSWQVRGHRRIRVKTTTRHYGIGSSKGDPVIHTTYEYL